MCQGESKSQKKSCEYIILHVGFLSYNRESMCQDESESQKKSCEYIILDWDDLYILHQVHFKKFFTL